MLKTINKHFYLWLSLWMWAIAIIGFTPGYFGPMAEGNLDKTDAVHIHAWIFIGWLALFSLQASLPALGKTGLHRRIGPIAVAYGITVIIAGLYVTFSRFGDWAAEMPVEKFSGEFLFPLTDMMVFPLLFGLAVYHRRTPQLHKRLMVLAGTMLLIAAVARMAMNGLIPQAMLHLVWLSPALLGMLRDWLNERRIYLSYALGIPFLFIVSLRALLVEHPTWLDFMRRLAT